MGLALAFKTHNIHGGRYWSDVADLKDKDAWLPFISNCVVISCVLQ